jgi:MoaA/NifB/PqqE/SkfB family radical SAM enzyme
MGDMPSLTLAGGGRALILNKMRSRIIYGYNTFILGKELPYMLVVVLTDKCNLNCFYCESKNTGRYHLSFNQAVEVIQSGYDRGHRVLVITGGEPTLWQDSGNNLNDLLQMARNTGYVDCFVYTNGTSSLSIRDCKYIVTIDGTKEIHNKIRDGSYDLIIQNIREAKTSSIYATVTINKNNSNKIEEIVDSITKQKLFQGISFNLLTHCKEIVQKYGLVGSERIEILDRIWAIKKKGYPLIFSKAAYKAMRANNWKRPIKQIELATRDDLFTCCRDVVNSDVCENCGYSSCVEVSQILALRPTAIWEMIRMAG